MSRIPAEGTNHYVVVYGLNCKKLKDNIAGHRSTQWKKMEECFRDICNIGTVYKQAEGYYRVELSILNTSGINVIKVEKKTGMCYKCRGP